VECLFYLLGGEEMFVKGDKVEVVKRCGVKGEVYEEGEVYTVLEVKNGIHLNDFRKKEKGAQLKENAKLIVPFEYLKKAN
jgi:hypothetical protein